MPKRKLWAMLKKGRKIHAKGHKKKWTQKCPNNKNNRYFDARSKKREKEIR
jgi:hypothetical protein